MPTTTLYFVRHGQTEYNRKRIVQGRGVDAELNATGLAQAAALGDRFGSVRLDAIYASTLLRARQTAAAVSERHPSVPRYDLEDLEEMSWGIHEGKGASPELMAMFESLHAEWAAGRYDRPIDGGESILDVQQRALQAVDHIHERHAGETVLVVTHGRFLRVLLATLLDDYGLARMQEIKHANTAVNHLTCAGGRYEAHLMNCTAHLEDQEIVSVHG